MLKIALAIAALGLPLARLHAQHALVLQKLAEWNGTAAEPAANRIEAEIRIAASKAYFAVPACAASPVIVDKVAPATAERFVFNGIAQRRMRNGWTVIARLPGCDAAPVRFMIMQDTSGALSTIRVNRGQSLAWDSLIGDTVPLAEIAAVAALKRQKIDCALTTPGKLGVTRVVNESEGLGGDVFGVRYAGSWSEVWPLKLCGRTVEVTVDFTADGDGGAYTKLPGELVTVLPD